MPGTDDRRPDHATGGHRSGAGDPGASYPPADGRADASLPAQPSYGSDPYPTDPSLGRPSDHTPYQPDPVAYPSDPAAHPSDPAAYPADPVPADTSATATPPKPVDRRSRAGSAWIALIIGTIVLIFLLVFVLQNGRSVEIHYFGWQFSLSVGVAMLFAAIGGALVAGLFGTVRILQLRTRARKAAR